MAVKAHAASGDVIDNEIGGAWDASATDARVCVDLWFTKKTFVGTYPIQPNKGFFAAETRSVREVPAVED